MEFNSGFKGLRKHFYLTVSEFGLFRSFNEVRDNANSDTPDIYKKKDFPRCGECDIGNIATPRFSNMI
jgi:hypothetical protein